MHSTIQFTERSWRPRELLAVNIGIIDTDKGSYGIVFFGTPHGGPGDDWRIAFGNACVRIAQSLPGVQANDIMEGLKKGSLFSDTLQNQWRHQLNQYQIITFYEGIGNVWKLSWGKNALFPLS